MEKEVNPAFESFLFDWSCKTYLLVGGYGSSKSYNIALKSILKLFSEKRKMLIIREVYDTIRDSCFDLLCEILEGLNMLEENASKKRSKKVIAKTSPMQLIFPNGSKIIFKGMDKPAKLKSINGISMIWIEEASEVKYAGYKELLGRLRHPTLSLHIMLSTNPVDKNNWVYTHFFKHLDDEGREVVVLDDEELYKKHTIIKNGVYYHHSTCDDNFFLPDSYTEQLEELKNYDPDLYRIARQGRFGITGTRVLPQFEVAESHELVMRAVRDIPQRFKFTGFDFGFETSYNAVVRMAVDDKEKVLYIFDEYYKNQMTDDLTAAELKQLGYDREPIVADCEDPKAIKYYRQQGFNIRGCHKFHGSRLENTRKCKRFKKIICSPLCRNCVRELSTLSYASDKDGYLIFDQFNIDPHTFSAIWYALDNYIVSDIKTAGHRNSRRGIGGKIGVI